VARTALEEMWGGYHLHSTVDGLLPLPSGVPGAARFIECSVAGMKLQDARLIEKGGPIYSIWCHSVGFVVIKDAANTTLASVAGGTPGSVTHCYLVDNSTQAGTWKLVTATASVSPPEIIVTDEFTFELAAGTNIGVTIRTLCDQEGYAGNNPVRVNVFVGPQGSATVGAVGGLGVFASGLPVQQGGEAMDTGTFPAGSIIILTVLENGYISGRGGKGGIGQPITGGTTSSPIFGSIVPANNGSDGLYIRTNTVLYNYGRVQGGGGGGSGGGAVGAVSGPGGGGGAGQKFSGGGVQGYYPSGSGWSGGGRGENGHLNAAGLGGGVGNGAPAGTGGTGGDPGQAGGDSSAGAGGFGQPGYAIRVDSGYSLTKVVPGNIDGLEGVL
jgi:hypothetical protein